MVKTLTKDEIVVFLADNGYNGIEDNLKKQSKDTLVNDYLEVLGRIIQNTVNCNNTDDDNEQAVEEQSGDEEGKDEQGSESENDSKGSEKQVEEQGNQAYPQAFEGHCVFAIDLATEDETDLKVCHIHTEIGDVKMRFDVSFGESARGEDLYQHLAHHLNLDLSELTIRFQASERTSPLEKFDNLSAYLDNDASLTLECQGLKGGAKTVKKSEKLAVVKVKCSKMAERVKTTLGHDLTKYNATYKTLVEDPEAIVKLVNEMPLTEANAVMSLLEEKKVKENTLHLIAKHIVPAIGEAQGLKEHYGTIYDALASGFYHAMTVAIFNDEKGKMDFSVLERMVAKKQGSEEAKRDMEI
eukprot:s624_g22.t1